MKTAKRFGRGDSRKRFSHRKVDKGGFEIWHLEKFFEKKSNVTDFAQTYLIFCVWSWLKKKAPCLGYLSSTVWPGNKALDAHLSFLRIRGPLSTFILALWKNFWEKIKCHGFCSDISHFLRLIATKKKALWQNENRQTVWPWGRAEKSSKSSKAQKLKSRAAFLKCPYSLNFQDTALCFGTH